MGALIGLCVGITVAFIGNKIVSRVQENDALNTLGLVGFAVFTGIEKQNANSYKRLKHKGLAYYDNATINGHSCIVFKLTTEGHNVFAAKNNGAKAAIADPPFMEE